MSETPHISLSSEKAFARRFRVLMAWHDLTLREIATASHNALSTVGTWKNGRMPSRTTIERLAEIFHVPVDYLHTGQWNDSTLNADEVAGRLLDDLDLLHRALQHGGISESSLSQRTKLARPAP